MNKIVSEETVVPRCVGIIMDGNRRWAKANGLPSYEGHRAGYDKVKEVMEWCRTATVNTLIVYAFSTENWKRAEEEVSYLLDLFRLLSKDLDTHLHESVRVRFIGERHRFPEDLQDSIEEIELRTRERGPYTLVIALSYGGRSEIVDAANRLVQEGGEVTEARLSGALWTAGIPDPDIIIRTGGEHRLSNFLPWQGVYSELFFLKSYWPALTEEEFNGTLTEYASRKRNFGS